MTKAVYFNLQGSEVGLAQRRNPIHFPMPSHTEREADLTWRDAAACIRELLDESGVAPGEIASVATLGYGAGL